MSAEELEILVISDQDGNFYGIEKADLGQYKLDGESVQSVKEATASPDDVAGYSNTTPPFISLGWYTPSAPGRAAWTASGARLRPAPRR